MVILWTKKRPLTRPFFADFFQTTFAGLVIHYFGFAKHCAHFDG